MACLALYGGNHAHSFDEVTLELNQSVFDMSLSYPLKATRCDDIFTY